MRSFNKPFVAALGTLNNEKPVLVLAASPDVAEKVNLREVVNMAASYIGGKGGGRPHWCRREALMRLACP